MTVYIVARKKEKDEKRKWREKIRINPEVSTSI